MHICLWPTYLSVSVFERTLAIRLGFPETKRWSGWFKRQKGFISLGTPFFQASYLDYSF